MGYQALLFCPDEKIARVVTHVLSDLEFIIETATEPFAAVKKLMAQHFDAIVVDCENEQNATLVFKSARNSSSNQASLAVAVVEGQAGVAKAFRIGANLVLTKPINVEQAKGTLRVARGLLRKGSESAKSSPAATAGPPVQSAQTQAAQTQAAQTQAAQTQAARADSLRTSPQDSMLPKAKFQVPKTATPETNPAGASTSGFELGKNSSSQAAASEAAMSDSNSSAGPASAHQSSDKERNTSKNFPWQRASKDSTGPVATPEASPVEQPSRPFMASASHGQAAATAPAREKPTSVTASASEIQRLANTVVFESGAQVRPPAVFGASAPAPSLSTRRSEDAGKESGGSSKILLGLVAILVMAVAGYFGWTETHGKAGKSAAGVKQVAIPTVPQPSAAQDAATPQIKDQTGNVPAESQAGHKGGTTATKSATPGSKPSAAIASGNKPDAKAASAESDVTVTNIEPMVVTNDVKRHSPAVSQAQPDVPVPNALNIAGGSGADKEISNIMTSTPVSVPKPVPQSIKVSQGVSQGLLIKKVQPGYPAQALAMRMQGAVQLQATINKDGSVSNLKVLSGEAILSRAAMDAVRQWKYKPYFLNGEPVEIQTQIVVNFKLPN